MHGYMIICRIPIFYPQKKKREKKKRGVRGSPPMPTCMLTVSGHVHSASMHVHSVSMHVYSVSTHVHSASMHIQSVFMQTQCNHACPWYYHAKTWYANLIIPVSMPIFIGFACAGFLVDMHNYIDMYTFIDSCTQLH